MYCFQFAAWLVFASVAFGDGGVTRQLESMWNPYCEEQLTTADCESKRLLYIKAPASDMSDVLHVLVSLWDKPACLLLSTQPQGNLWINWTILMSNDSSSGAIGVADQNATLSAYGVSMDELIEFDDPEDRADVYHSNATSWYPLHLESGQLTITNSTSMLRLSLDLNETGIPTEKGIVSLQFEMLNSYRRMDALPHLQQTGSSVVFGVVLKDLKTNSSFQHSRFGVQLTSAGHTSQQLALSKSLDDEYTPGVFKLLSLSSSGASSGGYLQWRPVAYTDREYTIEHSTTARQYNVTTGNMTTVSRLLRAYFGDVPSPETVLHTLPITFGLSQDGWYKETKYAAWSMTVGLGAVPSDELSLMVILLLGIGLGLPTAALIGGGLWLGVRRLRGTATPSLLIVNQDQ